MAQQIWPAFITLLTFGVLIWVMFIVGHYRGKYGVKAPAISGNPMFERAYRVQMNTIESVVIFLPALWLASRWGSWYVVAVAGCLWVAGRILYALGYLKDPAKRSLGFGVSFNAIIALIADSAIGVARALLA